MRVRRILKNASECEFGNTTSGGIEYTQEGYSKTYELVFLLRIQKKPNHLYHMSLI